MLARVAATLRDRHNVRLGFAGTNAGGDEHQIVLDENCSVSLSTSVFVRSAVIS